jgi:hypothetical protein
VQFEQTHWVGLVLYVLGAVMLAVGLSMRKKHLLSTRVKNPKFD